MRIIGESKDLNLIDRRIITKENINKILIFITLVIVVVTCASIAGIIIAKSYNEKRLAQYYRMMEENLDENEMIDSEYGSDIKENRTLPLPVYSENAKNRMANIYNTDSDEKIAYLTFDDGPSSNITPQIIQILREQGIKATFFLLGSRVDLYPDIVKQEYEEGHYIANHGYSHNYSSIYSSPNAVLDEYYRTEQSIRQALGNENYSSYLFRYPGGSSGGKYVKIKHDAKELLAQNNIAYLDWNSLTNDAVGKPTAESIKNDLIKTVESKNKIVVLMHDASNKQLTADTLRENISYLREQGYSFKNFYDIMCE